MYNQKKKKKGTTQTKNTFTFKENTVIADKKNGISIL